MTLKLRFTPDPYTDCMDTSIVATGARVPFEVDIEEINKVLTELLAATAMSVEIIKEAGRVLRFTPDWKVMVRIESAMQSAEKFGFERPEVIIGGKDGQQ